MLCLVSYGHADGPEVVGGPTYPTAGRAPHLQFNGALPSVELIGLDLAQNGARAVESPPAIEAGTPLDISLYFKPISARVETRQFRINLRPPGVGPAPGYLKLFDIGLENWEFREPYTKTYRMELPLRRFVGRGVLSISEVDPKERDWQRAAVLHTMQVNVPARTWPSGVDDARLHSVFDAGVKRLHAAFTLAPGTKISIPVESTQRPVTGIGVLSYVSWHEKLDTGAPLCRVKLRYADHAEQPAPSIVFGETTYKAIVSSTGNAPDLAGAELAWAEPVVSEGDSTNQRCIYKGLLPIAGGTDRPSEIVFEYSGETGMLDVFEVVLIEGS